MNSVNSKWYQSLKKSPLTPPSWVFPIAWTTLYLFIIASGVLFLMTNGTSVRSIGFLFYCVTWILNLSWTPIFFTYTRPDISFIIILVMVAFIALTIHEFYPVNRLASYLLIPYLGWVLFATYLNGYIVYMNPNATRNPEK